MNEAIEALTTAKIGLALDAAVLQHRAIASNIANAGVKGYVPLRMNFAAQMDRLLDDRLDMAQTPGDIGGAGQLRLEKVFDAQGQPAKVQLDMEMAAMAQNNVQYQALIRALNRHMAIQLTAANDGKR